MTCVCTAEWLAAGRRLNARYPSRTGRRSAHLELSLLLLPLSCVLGELGAETPDLYSEAEDSGVTLPELTRTYRRFC